MTSEIHHLDPLGQLSVAGVAVWLDDLSRERLRTGNLGDLIRDRHVVGITTNPTIFQKAISGADAYAAQLDDLATRGVDVGEALRAITTSDVRWGCDVLRPAYTASDTVDGRVSIEVDPRISGDAAKTIAEARALWWLVDRPNLFIKIPATLASLPAISQALAEGISVNVTLIFSLERYGLVIDAFLDGLERAQKAGLDLSSIGSVASFFVSRVDTEIDKRLDKIGTDAAKALKGKAAVANARLAYQLYEEKFGGERWAALAAAGAKVQRPLWASTGVKDPAYEDTMYVVDLVATTPSTPCRSRPCRPCTTTESSPVTPSAATTSRRRRSSTTSPASGISYDDVVDTSSARASRSSSSRGSS